MTITQTSPICNRESKLADSFIGKGNLIPHIWYHKILRSNGKPDTVGISILSELSYLYRSSKVGKREFQLSYSHFINKFNFTRDQIYEAFMRLESGDLVSRDERTIIIDGRRHGNELFLTINIENLSKLCGSAEDKEISVDENSSIPYEEISLPPIRKYPSTLQGNILVPYEEISHPPIRKFPDTPQGNILIPYEEISSMYIDKKDLKKDNSYSYSYSKSNCDEREGREEVSKKLPPVIATANLYYDKKRNLKKFHPISEDDGLVLCKLSGRDFDLDYINDLLLKLSIKNPKHSFYSKEIFLCYMAKILKGEWEANEHEIKSTVTTQSSASQSSTDIIEAPVIDQSTPWGKLRERLRNHYGRTGDALDRSWFSKLVPLETADSNNLILKAPTHFICDYIEQHYLHTIKQLCQSEQYSFSLTV